HKTPPFPYTTLFRSRSNEQQFQNYRAKSVTPRFHPKFQCKRDKKKPWNPNGERVEERRQCEEQCCGHPKQRSPGDTRVCRNRTPCVTRAHTSAGRNRLKARRQ